MRTEARGCKDVPVLTQAGGVLCHLAGVPDAAVCARAMQALLALLVNRYPKVGPAAPGMMPASVLAI